MNKIESGYSVTNEVPVGNYVVSNDADITLHAGNIVKLELGTHINPGSNGHFKAYIDPFFTCSQHPDCMLIKPKDSSNYPTPLISNYEVSKSKFKEKDSTVADKSNLLSIFPNPFNHSTTIKYKIEASQSVKILISNQQGQTLYVLKNKRKLEPGIYKIKLEDINLPSGIYYCTLITDNYRKTKKIAKVR